MTSAILRGLRRGRDWVAQAVSRAAAADTPGGPGAQPRIRQLVGISLAVAVLAAGLAGLPQPTSASVVEDADGLLAACAASPEGTVACAQGKLDEVLLAKGAEVAFRILENATREDTDLEREGHNLAHHLGRTAVSRYPSSQEALRHCPVTMASGCFHGILERHFTNVGPPTQASDLAGLCTREDGGNRFFQCLHGLGHGLDMVALHDLPQALEWCSLLADAWAQDSCAGGAFMENVVGDTSMGHGGHPHGASGSAWIRLKPDDPQYPCNAVAQRWWHACYWMQSSALLKVGKTMAQAFEACDGAPEGFDKVCYESMGRDISGATLRDPAGIVELCLMGRSGLRGHCVFGAVQEIVNNAGKADPGFAFCKEVPLRQKEDCYRGVGGMLRSLAATAGERRQGCERSEARYERTCLKAALS